MKRKILKFIARFTVFFRMNIFRDARVALIGYKYQELTNCYSEINTSIDEEKQELKKQNEILSKLNGQQKVILDALISRLPPDLQEIV